VLLPAKGATPGRLSAGAAKALLAKVYLTDDDFAKENRELKPEEIVNNIIDWMDTNTEGLNGSDEKSKAIKRKRYEQQSTSNLSLFKRK
jgi:hypothetical protein